MSRPNTSQFDTNSPGFAPETREAPKLGVYAPLNVRAAPDRAASLAEALGAFNTTIVQPMLQQRAFDKAKASTEEGMAAAGINAADAERIKRDKEYARGVKVIGYRRQIEDFTSEAAAWFAEHSREYASVEEVDKALDSLTLGRFEAEAKDPDFAEQALPRLLQVRGKLLAEFSATLTDEKKAQAVDDLGALAQADFSKGTLTREGVEALRRKLVEVVGRSESNQALVNIIRSIAVEAGDPAIMDLIPEQIAGDDGRTLPGPRNIPRYSIQIEAAKREAAGYGVTREALREATEQKAREERLAAVDNDVTGRILGGKPYLGAIREALARGDIDAARARTLAAFGESMASSRRRDDGKSVSVGGVADVQLGIANGSMDTADVQKAFTDGRLGDPGDPAVKEAAAKLLNMARQAGNAALRSAQAVSYRKMVESHYPTTDKLGIPKPEFAQRRADKVAAYNEAILSGADPEAAAKSVLDADGKSLNDAPATATANPVDTERAQIIRDVASGTSKAGDAPPVDPDDVERLLALGLIDKASAIAYLKKAK